MRPTAERAAPRFGVVASVALHIGLVAALFVSFNKKIDLPADTTPLVPVDLVTVSDQTNIAPMQKAEEKPEPPSAQTVEPSAPSDVAPPKFEVAPDAKPLPKVEPKPKPEAKPDTKKEAKSDTKNDTKSDKFDINDIQKLLAKKGASSAKTGSRDIKGVGAQTGMTADLASLLQSQIYRCWSPPTGTPHPERLIVKYDVYLNRDGSVAQPPQLAPESAGAAAGDPYMAAAAGAARRAIYTCSPYRLPAERYAQWRNFTFVFDPRQLDQ
jgi:hypothetical protein